MPPVVLHGRRFAITRATRVLAVVLAGLLGGCASAPAPKTASAPLLEAASGLFYLDPSQRERAQADVLASFVMLGALSDKYASSGGCVQPECKRDFADTLRTLGMAYSRLGLHQIGRAHV